MKTRGLLLALLVATAVVAVILSVKVGDKTPIEADVDRLLQAEADLTRANIQTLGRIISSYLATEGRLPASLQEVRAAGLMTAGAQDAWGREILYERRTEDAFRLTSTGRDGKLGTPNDIVVDV